MQRYLSDRLDSYTTKLDAESQKMSEAQAKLGEFSVFRLPSKYDYSTYLELGTSTSSQGNVDAATSTISILLHYDPGT